MELDRRALLGSLEGLLGEVHCLRLYELAREVPGELAIVELGSYKGRSSCYLAEGAKGKVFCVDGWDAPGSLVGRFGHRFGFTEPETYQEFLRQVRLAGHEDKITPLKGLTADVARSWAEHSCPIGLLFIDANHHYEYVKADFEAWSPFVVPTGCVAFDDYLDKPKPRVKKFVDELLDEGAWYMDGDPAKLVVLRRSDPERMP